MWKRGSRTYTEEEYLSEIREAQASCADLEVYVGADSQPFTEGTYIVVAVCLVTTNKTYHARCFYKPLALREPFMELYTRVYAEMDSSVSEALRIREAIPNLKLVIHLDVNSKPRGYTYRWSSGLVSIVKAFGFDRVEIKPNAWCASCVADKYTKRFQ